MKTSEIKIWNQPIEVDGGWVICTVEIEPGLFRLRRVPQNFVGAQGIQGETGLQGPQGIQGVTGDAGRNSGLKYTYLTNVAQTDPGAGNIKFGNIPLIGASTMNISKTDGDGNSLGDYLATWDDSSSAIRGYVIMRKENDPAVFAVFGVNADLTDVGTWIAFSVSGVVVSGVFSNNDVVKLEFIPSGSEGRNGGGVAFPYLFDDSNTTTPGVFDISFDTNALASIQHVYVNETDAESNLNTDALTLPQNAGDYLFIYDMDSPPSYAVLEVLSHSVAAGVHHYTVTPVADSGAFSNDSKIIFSFQKKGQAGASGDASVAGLKYTYDTNTAASDPGAGGIKFNNGTLGSATAMYISETDADSNILSGYLASWDDGTSTIKGMLVIRDDADPQKLAVFSISGTLTDNGAWDTFTVASVASSGVFANGASMRLNFIPTGDKGDTGTSGSNGTNGTDGRNAGIKYTYDTTTTATDPGSGKLQFNNTTLSSATALYISETDGDANALAAYIATWDDSTSTVRGILTMRKDSDPAVFAIFSISGTITDNGAWDTFTVAHIASNGSFSDNDVVKIHFFRTGDKGETGAAGASGAAVWEANIERAIDFHTGGTTMRGAAWGSTLSSSSANTPSATKLDGRVVNTSTTLNNSAFYELPNTACYFLSYNLKMVFMGNLNETTGNRCWIGFAAGSGATMFGSGDTPAVAFVGFRYSAGTDAEWKVVTYDGANLNVFTTGVSVSTTDTQVFRIEWENGGSEVRFYINGTLVKTATVQLPASATALRCMTGVKNTVGGAGTARAIVMTTLKLYEGTTS